MTSNVPWSVKGIDTKAREVAKDQARRSGMTLGEYLNHLITSGEGGLEPRSDAAAMPGGADLVQLTTALDRLSQRIEAAEQRSSAAISGVDQSVQGVLSRLSAAEQGQAAVAGRVDGLERGHGASGPVPVEAVKSLETALGKVAAQLYASDDRTGSTLGRIAERLDRAETETTTAVRRLETSFAGLDDRLRGVENRAPASAGVSDQRFEQLAGQLSARMEASRAEMAQMLERAAANRFAQLDRVVDGLTGHVEAAERRSHQAIEKLGHEVLRVADVLGKRMVQVENRSADAVEQVGGEVVRVAAAMEARLRVSDNAHAQALERLGEEIARISERLAERIAAAERRSAQAIDDVGDQVVRATDKIGARYDRAANDLAERIRSSEERTARFLDEARARIDSQLGDRRRGVTVGYEGGRRYDDLRYDAPEDGFGSAFGRQPAGPADPASPFAGQPGGPTRARLERAAPARLVGPEPFPPVAVAPPVAGPAPELSNDLASAPTPMAEDEVDILELEAAPPKDFEEAATQAEAVPTPETTLIRADWEGEPDLANEAADPLDERYTDEPYTDEAVTTDEPEEPEALPSSLSAEPASAEAPRGQTVSDDLHDAETFDPADEFELPIPPVVASEPHVEQVQASEPELEPEPAFEPLDEFDDLVAFQQDPSSTPDTEFDRDYGEPALPVMTDPGPPLSNRDVLERARAAARVGGSGKVGPLAARGGAAPPAPTAPTARGGLLSALRIPGLGKSSLRRGSTLRTALIASATAAALSVFFASWAIFAQDSVDGDIDPPGVQTASRVDASQPVAAPSQPRVAAITLQALSMPAGSSGEAPAVYAAAATRLQSGDGTAVADIRRAAALGHPAAQLHLASLYEAGAKGLAKDPAEARRWTSRAAEAGDRRAMHNLGLLHFEGIGGPKDLTLARQWFRRAADLGLSDSQYNLGLVHERGYGVSRNPAEAYKWFVIAARGGDAEARTAALRLQRTLSKQARTAAEQAAVSFRPSGLQKASAVAAVVSPQVATAQQALSRLGYYKGPADGRASPALREAVLAWQRATGVPADGVVNADVLAGLSAPS